ncbi:MAG TPA: hypothetical protein VFB06_21965 [Streptosporangiaceae bacterium]|nr:hypothetical protein [Streptosporangiaceae bacterium]
MGIAGSSHNERAARAEDHQRQHQDEYDRQILTQVIRAPRDRYATAARGDLDDEQAAAEPLAGNLFRLRPGPRGLPPSRFAG